MPDLRDAYLRVKRAEEHFEDLRRVNIDVTRQYAETTRFQPEPEGPVDPLYGGDDQKPFVRVHTGTAQIPDRVRILTGDIANNLRSALDYLIAQLAELDTGIEQSGTQFPIEDTPKGFKGRIKTYLRGLTETHIAVIERLQPYKGINWTKQLRALSNPDKHRKLHIVVGTFDNEIKITPTPVGTADKPMTKLQMEMRLKPSLQIVLGGHWPLIETMEKIRFHVVQTLEAFKPEFEGR